MTHLLIASKPKFKAILEHKITFDITLFPVKTGDRVIYQEVDDKANHTSEEHEVVVGHTYFDSDGIKKGYTAFGFDDRINHD